MERTRRAYLAGAAAAAGLAGCLDGLRGDGPSGGSGTPWSMPDHAALAGIDDQPHLGPPPGEAPGLVVGFEDPSCPACRQFHEGTLPDLRSDLFEAGRATFVYRGISIVAQWSAFATHALEATFDRDGDAHWALTEHYYAEQDAFTEGNVAARTESFLESETDVDAGAVVDAVEAGEYDDATRTDYEAATGTDLRGTPTFYLFADGEFRTDVVGPQDPTVFEEALGV